MEIMSYQKINLSENEDFYMEEEVVSLMKCPKEFKVQLYYYIIAPGPGTYRRPSDFGHYDEIIDQRQICSSGK